MFINRIQKRTAKFRASLLYLIFFLNSFSIVSQQHQEIVLLEAIENQASLSNTTINTIVQDSVGFLWIGTYDGLYRYDGHNLKSFQYEPNSNSGLASNIILELHIDNDNNLWGITPTKGIFKLDLRTEQIERFPELNKKIVELGGNTNSFYIQNKNIWIAANLGVIQLTNTNNTLTLLQFYSSFTKNGNHPINKIICDDESRVWLGTNTGLFCLKKTKSKSYDWQEVYLGTSVFDLKKRNNKIYFASANHIFSYSKDSISTIKTIHQQNLIRRLSIDSQNNLWSGSSKSLVVFNKTLDQKTMNTKKCSFIRPDNFLKDIRCFYEDSSGVVWIGTAHGLFKYNYKKSLFKRYYFTNKDKKQGLPISALLPNKDQSLWVGTEGGGLVSLDNIYNQNSNITQKYIALLDYKNEAITAIGYDKRNTFFYGTRDSQQLVIFNSDLELSYINTSSNYKRYMDIETNSKGNIWLATINNGITHLEKKDNNAFSITNYTKDLSKNHNFPSNVVRSIAFDENKNIWFGTDKGLVLLTDTESKKNNPVFEVFQHKANTKNSISADFILPIITSTDNTIWIGTFGGGLNKCRFNEKTGTYDFTAYTTKDGLQNNTIKSLAEDDLGNIWMGTNSGISKLNPKTNSIKNFSKKDGLTDNVFMDLSATRLSNGMLAFGGQSGLTIFKPSEIKSNNFTTNLAITKLEINNIEIRVNTNLNDRILLKNTISNTQNVLLKTGENNIAITFQNLNYSDQNDILSYKLEGIDKDWRTTKNALGIAKYSNIPSGDYIFKIKNFSNPDVKTKTLNIKVQSAHSFAILYILFFSIGVTLIIYFKTRYSKKQKSKISSTDLEAKISTVDQDFITKIEQEIIIELSNPDFTVSQLVQKMGLSEYLCNKKLKKLTGFTTNSYIREQRLLKASELLRASNLTIAEITYKVGFRDLEYFRNCFKKKYGNTPSTYQKNKTQHT